MSRMSDLSAQGVKDLHSYSVGWDDCLSNIIDLLDKSLADDHVTVFDSNGNTINLPKETFITQLKEQNHG